MQMPMWESINGSFLKVRTRCHACSRRAAFPFVPCHLPYRTRCRRICNWCFHDLQACAAEFFATTIFIYIATGESSPPLLQSPDLCECGALLFTTRWAAQGDRVQHSKRATLLPPQARLCLVVIRQTPLRRPPAPQLVKSVRMQCEVTSLTASSADRSLLARL